MALLGQSPVVLSQRDARKRRCGRLKSEYWVYFILDTRTPKARADATCTGCKACLLNAQPMKDLVPHLMRCKKIDPLVRARAAKDYKQHHEKRRRHYRPEYRRIVVDADSDEEEKGTKQSSEFVPAPAISTEEFHQLISRMIYKCLLPFSTVKREAFVECFTAIRPDLKLPGLHALSNKLLDDTYAGCKENVEKRLKDQRHVSIASYGWSDRTRSEMINFVLTAPGMRPVLWSSVATKNRQHTAGYEESLMNDTIKQVQEHAVVSGILTDNAANMPRAWEAIETKSTIIGNGCAAHVLSLLLQDVERHIAVFDRVKEHALEVIRFTRDHSTLLSSFKQLQQQLLAVFDHRRALTLPVATRWHSLVTCFQSVLSSKVELEALFASQSTRQLLKAHEEPGRLAREKVQKIGDIVRDRNNTIWSGLSKAVQYMNPIIQGIRKLESDDCPPSFVYKVFRDLLFNEEYRSGLPHIFLGHHDSPPTTDLSVWQNLQSSDTDEEKFLKLVWRRWQQVRKNAFGMAFLLDPAMNPDEFVLNDLEETVLQVCAYAEKANMLQHQRMDKYQFERKLDRFIRDQLKKSPERRAFHMDPVAYWEIYGALMYPALSEIATIVFSIPPTSAASERVRSKLGVIHSAKRLRLDNTRLEKLSYIYINDCGKEVEAPDDVLVTKPSESIEVAEFLDDMHLPAFADI